MATQVSRYIDPAATGTGAGTSWADAYTTWDGAINDIAADYPNFTTADVAVTLWVRGNVDTGTTVDPAFTGTSKTNFFKLAGDPAATTGATWNASAPTLSSSDWDGVVRVNCACIVEDLQVLSTRTSGSGGHGAGVRWESGTFLRVNRCKVKTNGPEANGGRVGIRTNDNTATDKRLEVINNITINYYVGIYLRAQTNDHFIVHSNLVYGSNDTASYRGIAVDMVNTGTLRLKNNLVTRYPNNDDFWWYRLAATNDVSHNASEDGTGDNVGTNSRVNQTFTFVDPVNGDYHLAATDTGAKGFGVNLSADANYAYSDDIDNQNRADPWDIGADATTVSGSSLDGAAQEGVLSLVGYRGGFAVDPGGFMDGNQDPGGSPVSYKIVTSVASGTLVATVGGALDYTPNNDFVGEDSFTYYVYADGVESSLGTVKFLVEDFFSGTPQLGLLGVFGERASFQQPTAFAAQAQQGTLDVIGQPAALSGGIVEDAPVGALTWTGESGAALQRGFSGTAKEGSMLFVHPFAIFNEAEQGHLEVTGERGVLNINGRDGILSGEGPADDGSQLDRPPFTVHMWLTRATKVKLRR